MSDKTEGQLTEREKELVQAVAEAVFKRAVVALKSGEVADTVINTWTGALDRMIGKAIRRVGGMILLAFLMWAAVKMDVVEKLIQGLSK